MRAIDTGLPVRLAALGVASGLLGSFLPGPSFGEANNFGLYMILTGVWFALVVGIAVWHWGDRPPRAVVVAAAATWIAWELAVNVAMQLDQRWLDPLDLSETASLAVSGIIAGALGAVATWAGVAGVEPALRERAQAVTFAVIGAFFGILLAASINLDYPIVLFVPWQVAIAYGLGAALARHPVKRDVAGV